MVGHFVKSVTRPHYLYRPLQIFRRIYRQFVVRPNGLSTVTMPWGADMIVDPREHIGRSIYFHGIYGLVVSEALWRLLEAGGVAVDVGAHVGHMTSLMVSRVGTFGSVLAFEPHQRNFQLLEKNGRSAENLVGGSPLSLFNVAVSNHSGRGELCFPEGFEKNQGTAYLHRSGSSGIKSNDKSVIVNTTTLEDSLNSVEHVSVLKIDTEGHEKAVLDGATHFLSEGRIVNVVYEQHAGWAGPAHESLLRAGYTLFGLNWRHTGPYLIPYGKPLQLRAGEGANFLATLLPFETKLRFAKSGWHCLGRNG